MVRIAGGYEPGSAWGTHSGYDIGGAPMGGGVGPPAGTWGFLRKQQAMRDRMAQAQLDLIAEQINASRQERADRIRQMNEAFYERQREDMWRRHQAKEKGDRAIAMAAGLLAPSGTSAFQTPETIAAAGGGDPEMMHAGLMQSGRILGQLGATALAGTMPMERGPDDIRGGFRYEGMGGDTFTGPTYPEGTNVSVQGGPNPLMQIPPAQVGMPITRGQLFTNRMPNIGEAVRPYLSPGLQPMEKGTLPGTVQRTGPAVVHEGEAIIPEEQVDEPLLRYLRRDALRKGVPLGQASGGEYKCGTLRYQEGSLGEGGWGDFWRVVGEAKEEAARGEAARRGILGFEVSPKPVAKPKVPKMPAAWSTYSGPAQVKEMANIAKKELGDDAIKALSKTKKGQTLLTTLGILGAGAAAAGAEEPLPWWKMMLMATPVTQPGLIGYEAMKRAQEQIAAGEEPSGPRVLGEALKETVGGAGAGVLGPLAEFGRGIFPEWGEEEEAAPAAEPEAEEEVPMLPPQAPPAGTLETALEQFRSGAPMELRGEPEPPFPESYEDLRALPENITARHKAQMNMVQAEKILDHLQFHGHELDPGAYAMMQDQAKQKMGLAQMYGKQVQSREQYAQQGQKLMQEMMKKLTEIEARGEQARTTEQLKAQNRMTLTRLRESATMVRQLVAAMTQRESAARRSDAKEMLIAIIQGAQQQRGDAVTDEGAILDRLDAVEEMSPEDQTMFIVKLEEALKGLR